MFQRYPFYQHIDDAAVGLKEMFMRAGVWQLSVVALPRTVQTPVQSPEFLNNNLLRMNFGPSLEGLPALPKDVELYLADDTMKTKVWRHIRGAPPNQSASFLFDFAPFQTWYLQGKGHWAYAMLLACSLMQMYAFSLFALTVAFLLLLFHASQVQERCWAESEADVGSPLRLWHSRARSRFCRQGGIASRSACHAGHPGVPVS